MKTKADHDRALATVRELMSRPRTAEEDALFDVLADLIERYESRTYPGLGHDPTNVGSTERQTETEQSSSGVTRKTLQDLARRFRQLCLLTRLIPSTAGGFRPGGLLREFVQTTDS